MPRLSVRTIVPASAARAFAVLHDYDRRLEWDTMLSRADLVDGWDCAEKDAVTVCRGRWFLGGLALKTCYVSFIPGRVAAVRMLNRPAFFGAFAATIRHDDLEADPETERERSEVLYILHFTTRPTWLRRVLEPVMSLALRHETNKRLLALGRYLEANRDTDQRAEPTAAQTSERVDDFGG